MSNLLRIVCANKNPHNLTWALMRSRIKGLARKCVRKKVNQNIKHYCKRISEGTNIHLTCAFVSALIQKISLSIILRCWYTFPITQLLTQPHAVHLQTDLQLERIFFCLDNKIRGFFCFSCFFFLTNCSPTNLALFTQQPRFSPHWLEKSFPAQFHQNWVIP